jgi:hydrogenase-4 component E
MTVLSDMLVMVLLLTNMRILASSRIDACIQAVVIQAFLLGILTITASLGHLSFEVILLTGTTVAVKGVLLPWLLRRAVRDAGVNQEIEPFVGYAMSVLIGAGLLGICYAISRPLQEAAPAGTAAMLIPGAMFTILTGLFIIVSRRKALTQVIGYLTMENGVYVFGASLALDEPMLVEMGILLDVFVAVFVMGIVIHQINREFDHIDTDRLSELKD